MSDHLTGQFDNVVSLGGDLEAKHDHCNLLLRFSAPFSELFEDAKDLIATNVRRLTVAAEATCTKHFNDPRSHTGDYSEMDLQFENRSILLRFAAPFAELAQDANAFRLDRILQLTSSPAVLRSVCRVPTLHDLDLLDMGNASALLTVIPISLLALPGPSAGIVLSGLSLPASHANLLMVFAAGMAFGASASAGISVTQQRNLKIQHCNDQNNLERRLHKDLDLLKRSHHRDLQELSRIAGECAILQTENYEFRELHGHMETALLVAHEQLSEVVDSAAASSSMSEAPSRHACSACKGSGKYGLMRKVCNFCQGSGKIEGLPIHWCNQPSSEANSMGKPVLLTEQRDSDTLAGLRRMLDTDPTQLGTGRDVKQPGRHYSLSLHKAWRIEHGNNYRTYMTEIRNFASKFQGKKAARDPKLRAPLVSGSFKLPGVLNRKIGEVRLLHGTSPSHVMDIIHNGLNENFSRGLFGKGTYLAEDAGKCDQYCKQDLGAHGLRDNLDGYDPDCFYVFVVRTILGHFVRTDKGVGDYVQDLDHGGPVWADDDFRELANIHGVKPAEPYHSLIAEKRFLRYREFVKYKASQTYVEYLVAYRRPWRPR